MERMDGKRTIESFLANPTSGTGPVPCNCVGAVEAVNRVPRTEGREDRQGQN